MEEPGWVVVTPVKPLSRAKTRLRAGWPQPPHQALVLAMVQDTVAAAVACRVVERMVVVTDDADVAKAGSALGAVVVPDRPAAGLNAAVEHGLAAEGRPGFGSAVVTADLPALRPGELATALREVVAVRKGGFVSDAAGGGTTLVAVPPDVPLHPRFGPGSAAAHADAGLRRLAGDWPSLRCDVDTPADLAAAARLGLGRYTTALAAVPADQR